MRILLDECVDRRLASHFAGHLVQSVTQRGWAGAKNGELLHRAQSEFDIFLTTDQNLQFEQNIQSYSIAIVVLCGKSNRLADLQELVTTNLAAIQLCKPRTITRFTV